MKFYLDKKPMEFGADQLPMLISGKDKSGASFFSVSVVSRLFLAGEKILFFSLHQPAVDRFKEQCVEKSEQILYLKDFGDLDDASKYPAVVVKSGDSHMCIETITELQDIEKRVIFVKNFENTLTRELLSLLISNKRVIIAGDIDRSQFAKDLAQKHYSTTVVFSKPDIDLGVSVPKLSRYCGYLVNAKEKGIVSLEMV